METVCFSALPHAATHRFSPLVLDYLAGAEALAPFCGAAPDDTGIAQALEARAAFPTDRATLVRILHQQYEGLALTDAVRDNIDALADESTFTVCTAHQPALLTGALYFPYKILHTIRLAQHLAASYPQRRFVPVYYLGSEDNDLDELGTFRYGGRRFRWDGAGQRGAVGRMRTDSLQQLLEDLFRVLGPPGPHLDGLKALLEEAYRPGRTIAEATRLLVDALFGRYGLVVLDADAPDFKRAMLPVFKDDLLQSTPFRLVSEQSAALEAAGYTAQAYPRPVNLFYLRDNLRERIEKTGDRWSVVGTDVVWQQDALLEELDAHPERFSPNVVLRGLLQETILPNIAFIGGGSELAYWLQLKPLFDQYGVPYPAVVLRQSIQWLEPDAAALRRKLEMSPETLFEDREPALRALLQRDTDAPWELAAESQALRLLLEDVARKATAIDPTLTAAVHSAATGMEKRLKALEQKMYRAEKRKHAVTADRLDRLRMLLFPAGGLQERSETFLDFYPRLGGAFFDALLRHTDPYGSVFLLAEEPVA